MPSKYQPKPEIDPATVIQTPTSDGRIAYWVASRSGKNICYLVEQRGASLFCSCPARKPCCHIRAVEARIALDAEAAKVAARAELANVFAEHCFDECLDLAAAHEEALAAEQAKAEQLVQLPRELHGAPFSEEYKMGYRAIVEKAQAERSAKRERACLYTDNRAFSIFKS
jgi:hypothetical protein